MFGILMMGTAGIVALGDYIKHGGNDALFKNGETEKRLAELKKQDYYQFGTTGGNHIYIDINTGKEMIEVSILNEDKKLMFDFSNMDFIHFANSNHQYIDRSFDYTKFVISKKIARLNGSTLFSMKKRTCWPYTYQYQTENHEGFYFAKYDPYLLEKCQKEFQEITELSNKNGFMLYDKQIISFGRFTRNIYVDYATGRMMFKVDIIRKNRHMYSFLVDAFTGEYMHTIDKNGEIIEPSSHNIDVDSFRNAQKDGLFAALKESGDFELKCKGLKGNRY